MVKIPKKHMGLITPIDDDPCRTIIKRFKEKRSKVLKQSLNKLKRIPDAEQCLRQAVLIRNTFILTKDLSPKQFERRLLTEPLERIERTHSDLVTIEEEPTISNQTCNMAANEQSSSTSPTMVSVST